jgi:hypothetical protein
VSGLRRRTGLALAGLGAAGLLALAIVVAPRLGDGEPTCRDPSAPGAGATIAADSGGLVVGLTTRPDDRQTTIQVLGARGPVAADDLVVLGRGLAGDPRATSTAGCYVVDGLPAPGAPVTVTGRAGAESLSASATVPTGGRAEGLLARARRATAGLHGLRERQRVGRRADRGRVPVRVDYRGSGYTVRAEGDPPRRAREPGWRDGFYWMDPADYLLVRRVGAVRRDGRTLVRLSGYLPVPLWLEIDVDPRTGLVQAQRMHAAAHFMTSAFDRFTGEVPGDRRG